MNQLAKDVTRQALIEYLATRRCFENEPWHIADGLLAYVNKRYASHDQAFRDRKLAELGPRIAAAFAALEEITS